MYWFYLIPQWTGADDLRSLVPGEYHEYVIPLAFPHGKLALTYTAQSAGDLEYASSMWVHGEVIDKIHIYTRKQNTNLWVVYFLAGY